MSEIELDLQGQKVMIDEELIPLIKELNNLGLITTQCCSGHGKEDAYVSISLKNITDIAVRNDTTGPRLVIWWNPKPSKPNYKEVIHSEAKKR